MASWQPCHPGTWPRPRCTLRSVLGPAYVTPSALHLAPFSGLPMRPLPRCTSHPHMPLRPRRPHRPLLSNRFHRSHRADRAWDPCVLAPGVPRLVASWHPGSPGILDCDRSSEFLWVPQDPFRTPKYSHGVVKILQGLRFLRILTASLMLLKTPEVSLGFLGARHRDPQRFLRTPEDSPQDSWGFLRSPREP